LSKGRLVQLTVTAQNTNETTYDLLVETVITIAYPGSAPPIPDPARRPPPPPPRRPEGTTMKRHGLVLVRLRAVLAATIFAFTAFSVAATPIANPITKLLGLAPQTAAAANCATQPAFTGRLTASSSSTVAVSRITNGTVFGYLSNVDGTWGCTTGSCSTTTTSRSRPT
jgi:hypothetical protein